MDAIKEAREAAKRAQNNRTERVAEKLKPDHQTSRNTSPVSSNRTSPRTSHNTSSASAKSSQCSSVSVLEQAKIDARSRIEQATTRILEKILNSASRDDYQQIHGNVFVTTEAKGQSRKRARPLDESETHSILTKSDPELLDWAVSAASHIAGGMIQTFEARMTHLIQNPKNHDAMRNCLDLLQTDGDFTIAGHRLTRNELVERLLQIFNIYGFTMTTEVVEYYPSQIRRINATNDQFLAAVGDSPYARNFVFNVDTESHGFLMPSSDDAPPIRFTMKWHIAYNESSAQFIISRSHMIV